MQFILKVFRNFADIILSSAFFCPLWFKKGLGLLRLEEIDGLQGAFAQNCKPTGALSTGLPLRQP